MNINMEFLCSIIDMKERISALVIAFSLAVMVQAQNGQVKGFVKTSDGMPAAQVNVQLKEIKKGSTSAEDGSYGLFNIPEGKYTLIVSFVGLQTIQKSVDIRQGETNNLDFTLFENENQLAEIVIIAGRTMNEKPVTIGKLAIKPMDLPQSV